MNLVDQLHSVDYYYDLELDDLVLQESGYIQHPDFLWAPAPTLKLASRFDKDLKEVWETDKAGPLPREWASKAVEAAQERMPLGSIVNTLLSLSRKESLAQ
jgi:hypothetical protein